MKLNLEDLQNKAIKQLLKLDKYAYIINNIDKCENITTNIKLKKYFNNFYAINAAKKGTKWQENYYNCFQEMLELKKNNQEINFLIILKKISIDGKVEASFASKILATLNPNMPVWDINVIKNLKKELLLNPNIKKILKINRKSYTILGNSFEEKIENASLIYESLVEIETNIISKQKTVIAKFRKHYEKLIIELFDEKELSDMKILDFFLWMNRS